MQCINTKTFLTQYLLDKHYYSKHGANAYYGQNNAHSKDHAAHANYSVARLKTFRTKSNLMDIKIRFWFVTGSQFLYGEEQLKSVADAEDIVNKLNESGKLPYKVVFKGVMTTAEGILSL